MRKSNLNVFVTSALCALHAIKHLRYNFLVFLDKDTSLQIKFKIDNMVQLPLVFIIVAYSLPFYFFNCNYLFLKKYYLNIFFIF